MPVVRSVTPAEVDRAGEIGAIAFGGETGDWQKAFHEFIGYFGTDSMLVVEHEGALVSTMLMVGEGMWLGEHKVPARAVAAVATVPEARCIGCAGAMMREATRRMKAWGIAASPMWPFSFVYYRKFGWEIGGEARVVTWPCDLAFRIAPEGEVSAVTPDDGPALASVWDAAGPRHRCATARVTEHWNRLLRPTSFGGAPGKGGLVCRQGGKPAGYLLYQHADPAAEPSTEPAAAPVEGQPPAPVGVAELRALTPAAEAALLMALPEAVPDTIPGAARFQAAFPPGSRLRSYVVNPRALEVQLDANFGFRVIAPDQVLKTLSTERPLAPVRLRVEDELLGSQTWEVCFDGGPATTGPTGAAPDLTLDIAAFSQVASGYLPVSAAAESGLLTGDPSALARLAEAASGWTAPFRSSLEEG